MNKKFLQATATLFGTVIGAGVLGLPYVIAKAGYLIGLIQIIVLGLVVLFMYLYLEKITRKTKGHHQLTGYAEIYLGKKGKALMWISMLIGIYGAITAYYIGISKSLAALIGGSPLIYGILIFILTTPIIHKGINLIKRYELVLGTITLIIISTISLFLIPKIQLANLTTINLSNFFAPYGIILFAFLGAAAIPEMKEALQRDKKMLRRAVVIGGLIPLIAYILFSVAVVGTTGIKTTQVATIGLGETIGFHMVILGNLFAIFAMTTSFLALGLALRQVYNFDYNLSKKISTLLACTIPFVLFIILTFKEWAGFANVLNVTGVFSGGLEGILIMSMYWSFNKKANKIPGIILILLFITGAVFLLI